MAITASTPVQDVYDATEHLRRVNAALYDYTLTGNKALTAKTQAVLTAAALAATKL